MSNPKFVIDEYPNAIINRIVFGYILVKLKSFAPDIIINIIFQFTINKIEEPIFMELVFFGDTNVGKTCIVTRYTEYRWVLLPNPTIGANLKTKRIEIDKQSCELKILDTSGTQRYRYMAPLYYQEAMGIFLLYDITNEDSFLNMRSWIEEIQKKARNNIQLILIGNKCDLNGDRVITYEKGNELANEYNIPFIETSAKNNINIDKAFAILFRKILINIYNTIIPQKQPQKDGNGCYIL